MDKTPWERENGTFPADLFRSWMHVMTQPGEFFRSLDPQVSFARPLIFYLIFSVIGSGASLLSSMAVFGDVYREVYAIQGLGELSLNTYLWMNFFFSPFGALIALLFYVGMVHAGVHVFVQNGRPIGVTARTLCYVAAPAVLSIVPILGWAISFIWTAALAIIGIQWTHQTTFGRAFAAVIIPPTVVTITIAMFFVVLSVFFALAIGAAV